MQRFLDSSSTTISTVYAETFHEQRPDFFFLVNNWKSASKIESQNSRVSDAWRTRGARDTEISDTKYLPEGEEKRSRRPHKDIGKQRTDITAGNFSERSSKASHRHRGCLRRNGDWYDVKHDRQEVKERHVRNFNIYTPGRWCPTNSLCPPYGVTANFFSFFFFFFSLKLRMLRLVKQARGRTSNRYFGESVKWTRSVVENPSSRFPVALRPATAISSDPSACLARNSRASIGRSSKNDYAGESGENLVALRMKLEWRRGRAICTAVGFIIRASALRGCWQLYARSARAFKRTITHCFVSSRQKEGRL